MKEKLKLKLLSTLQQLEIKSYYKNEIVMI